MFLLLSVLIPCAELDLVCDFVRFGKEAQIINDVLKSASFTCFPGGYFGFSLDTLPHLDTLDGIFDSFGIELVLNICL